MVIIFTIVGIYIYGKLQLAVVVGVTIYLITLIRLNGTSVVLNNPQNL